MATFRPKEVLQLARDAEAQGKNEQAATHYASLSSYLRRHGKLDEALALIRKAVGLAPHYSRLYLQLSLCAELKGEKAEADVAIERFSALALEKRKVEQYRPLVESTLADHPRLKQKFFEAILVLDRTGVPAFLGRANALKEQGETEAAIGVLLDALQTQSETTSVLKTLEDLLRSEARSEALIHLGRFREGKISPENFVVLLSPRVGGDAVSEVVSEKPLRGLIEDLEKEMGIDIEAPYKEVEPLLQDFRKRSQAILGKDAQARMDMAIAYFEMGLYAEATAELGAIDAGDSQFGQSQVLMGEIYLAQGSELSALECFQSALRAKDSTFEVLREARYQLAQVFFRLGDYGQADGLVAELEKVAPDYRGVRWLKNQIQSALEKQTGRSA